MRMKRQVTGWDKTFGKDTSDKGQNPLKNKETTHLKKMHRRSEQVPHQKKCTDGK